MVQGVRHFVVRGLVLVDVVRRNRAKVLSISSTSGEKQDSSASKDHGGGLRSRDVPV